ncbi:DnaJ domain containing protein, putative [Angomonas deanei]|uniref:DnaJ domain containing protein, putative n=1 Tax=Angomonas deanei TaxID=59799 RepID=A0A7G2C536_9TRYP|nr:DnaJ domain containing protein, putative [Angomonas deanei]
MDISHIHFIVENPKDYYGILQIPVGSNEETIRKSYRRLMLQLHPDKMSTWSSIDVGSLSTEEKEELYRTIEIACRYVQQSYDVLKDKEVREVYQTMGAAAAERFLSTGVSPAQETWEMARVGLFLIALSMSNRTCQQDAVYAKFSDLSQKFSYFAEQSEEAASDFHFYRQNHEARSKVRRRVFSAFWKLLVVLLCLLFVGPLWWNRRRPVDLVALNKECWQSAYGLYSTPAEGVSFDVEKSAVDTVWGRSKYVVLGQYQSCSASAPPGAATVTVRLHGVPFYTAEELVWFSLEKCLTEESFRLASRDRFAKTSTTNFTAPVQDPESPPTVDRSKVQRKYAKKRWHFKYEDYHSVKEESELFQSSQLCDLLV